MCPIKLWERYNLRGVMILPEYIMENLTGFQKISLQETGRK